MPAMLASSLTQAPPPVWPAQLAALSAPLRLLAVAQPALAMLLSAVGIAPATVASFTTEAHVLSAMRFVLLVQAPPAPSVSPALPALSVLMALLLLV